MFNIHVHVCTYSLHCNNTYTHTPTHTSPAPCTHTHTLPHTPPRPHVHIHTHSHTHVHAYLRRDVIRGTTEGPSCYSPKNSLLAHPKVCYLAMTLGVKEYVIQLQVSVHKKDKFSFQVGRVKERTQ